MCRGDTLAHRAPRVVGLATDPCLYGCLLVAEWWGIRLILPPHGRRGERCVVYPYYAVFPKPTPTYAKESTANVSNPRRLARRKPTATLHRQGRGGGDKACSSARARPARGVWPLVALITRACMDGTTSMTVTERTYRYTVVVVVCIYIHKYIYTYLNAAMRPLIL